MSLLAGSPTGLRVLQAKTITSTPMASPMFTVFVGTCSFCSAVEVGAVFGRCEPFDLVPYAVYYSTTVAGTVRHTSTLG